MRRRGVKGVKLAMPITLVVVGVWLLTGCIFIPTFDKTIRGRNVSEYIGSAKQARPIRLHAATRNDVLRILGEPHFASPDSTRIAYVWYVRNGMWLWPLCFTAFPQDGSRALLLTFDEAGVLRTSEVLKLNGNWLYGRVERPPFMPDDMVPQPVAGAAPPSPTTQSVAPSRSGSGL